MVCFFTAAKASVAIWSSFLATLPSATTFPTERTSTCSSMFRENVKGGSAKWRRSLAANVESFG